MPSFALARSLTPTALLTAAAVLVGGCYCDAAPCPLNGTEIRLELPNLNGKAVEGTYFVEAAATYDEGSPEADVMSATIVYDGEGNLVSYDPMPSLDDPSRPGFIEPRTEGDWIVLTMSRAVNHRGIVGGVAPVSVAVKLTRDTDVLYDEVVEPDIERIEEKTAPSRLGVCDYCEGSYTELRLP